MKAVKVILPYLAGVLVGVIVGASMAGCSSNPKSEKLPAPVMVSGGTTSGVSKVNANGVPDSARQKGSFAVPLKPNAKP